MANSYTYGDFKFTEKFEDSWWTSSEYSHYGSNIKYLYSQYQHSDENSGNLTDSPYNDQTIIYPGLYFYELTGKDSSINDPYTSLNADKIITYGISSDSDILPNQRGYADHLKFVDMDYHIKYNNQFWKLRMIQPGCCPYFHQPLYEQEGLSDHNLKSIENGWELYSESNWVQSIKVIRTNTTLTFIPNTGLDFTGNSKTSKTYYGSDFRDGVIPTALIVELVGAGGSGESGNYDASLVNPSVGMGCGGGGGGYLCFILNFLAENVKSYIINLGKSGRRTTKDIWDNWGGKNKAGEDGGNSECYPLNSSDVRIPNTYAIAYGGKGGPNGSGPAEGGQSHITDNKNYFTFINDSFGGKGGKGGGSSGGDGEAVLSKTINFQNVSGYFDVDRPFMHIEYPLAEGGDSGSSQGAGGGASQISQGGSGRSTWGESGTKGSGGAGGSAYAGYTSGSSSWYSGGEGGAGWVKFWY